MSWRTLPTPMRMPTSTSSGPLLGSSAGLLVCTLLLVVTRPCHAYINSGLPVATHKAWLEDMTGQILATSVGDLTPEMLEAAPQVMSAWADNPFDADKSKSSSNSAPTMAVERLMKRLVAEQTATGNSDAANTYAYNALLHGWARSGEGEYAAQRAEQILIEMQDRCGAGNASVQPNTASFRSVLLAWERASSAASAARKRQEATHAAQRAQRILEWIISLHETGVNESATPTSECFDIVMKAWSQTNHADAPQITEQLLVRMEQLHREGNTEDVQPQTRHYNHVLRAWQQNKAKGSAQRAEEILDHMNKLATHTDNPIHPDFDSFNACLTAWAGSDENCSARKAESVLRKMESAYKHNSNKDLEPDAVMYNIVIDAWAKVTSTAKTNGKLPYESARKILDRQIDLHEHHGAAKCRPDAYGYTSVIKACDIMAGRSQRQREKAFRVAETTFLELCSSDHAAPNHVAYGTMLKACAHLLSPGSKRRELISRLVFDKACRDGCVGAMVINRFKEAASAGLYKEVMGNIKKNSLPYDWTFRVPKSDQALHRQKRKKNKSLKALHPNINKKTSLKP